MNFLNKIVEQKKEEVKFLRSKYSYSFFAEQDFFKSNSLSIVTAINNKDRISLIAEIKKASPSKGTLIENFDHYKIASIYMQNDVDAISILTDKNFFSGDINYLKEIALVKTKPLLRKDFIIDEFQIYEAKAFGADAVLLIAEILSKEQISYLTDTAKECGLEVLLELHSISQLDKIDFNKNKLIGINNRNLETFEVDLETTKIVSKYLPNDIIIVSESGINSKDDLEKIKNYTVNAILIGEYFMKSKKLEESLKEFKKYCIINN
ncbi:MAG: indole-3-glycerol phosphate synthase TrpC [Melioribacter sp.]|nr:indole-3-glycerol phosphate synthase TrpC [Melioribacter sp.]